jgi:hypothetical protein
MKKFANYGTPRTIFVYISKENGQTGWSRLRIFLPPAVRWLGAEDQKCSLTIQRSLQRIRQVHSTGIPPRQMRKVSERSRTLHFFIFSLFKDRFI